MRSLKGTDEDEKNLLVKSVVAKCTLTIARIKPCDARQRESLKQVKRS
jgi:hypothetical protein